MATRKNARNLTSTEKADFVRAIRTLKNNNSPGNIYNQFVRWHSQATIFATLLPGETGGASYRNAAHRGPAFHPWHREMLRRLELELQKIVPGIAIPYWDWTQDTANPSGSPIWRDDFMGGNGDGTRNWAVRRGPFREGQWTIIDENGNNAGPLRRQFGSGGSTFPTSGGVGIALGETPYDNPQWSSATSPSHRNRLEGFLSTPLHNRVHAWVGQTMQRVLVSPNDPVFFLHHCNVDRLWAQWQAQNPSQEYLPTSGGPPRHNLDDQMYPWDVTPASVLNIADLGYDYA
jgi:tyrosinase